jgi:CDP-diacylglycerol--glycerol-3-phosphate 3-phosphatidyltransferase
MKWFRYLNLPNKITVIRMLCVIVLIVLALLPWKAMGAEVILFAINGVEYTLIRVIMFALFAIASFTDFLDGHIARSRNLVTTFGKFMDPIADKLLVNTLFIILGVWGEVPALCVVIFIARDTIVDAIRMIAVERQKVIAASKLGKLKTVAQMVSIILLLIQVDKLIYPVGTIFVYIAAACSLISGIDYFWKNRHIVLEGANYRG